MVRGGSGGEVVEGLKSWPVVEAVMKLEKGGFGW